MIYINELQAAFGFGKSKPPNFQPLFTSGGFVTFQLQKSNPNNYNFNIKVYITSMPGIVIIRVDLMLLKHTKYLKVIS